MADIVTNTLQIGSNNLVLRDADAQAKVAVNTQDISDLKEDYSDILNSAYVTDTASGSIASFPDGAGGVPVKNLTVNIEPVQSGSGDPSPDNVRPISGHTQAVVTRCGKNLATKTIHGYVRVSDKKVLIDNDSESVVFYAESGKTYTVSSSATMGRSILGLASTDEITSRFQLDNAMELSGSVNTWTATWTGWTVWYKCTNAQSAFANSVQVEEGSTATAYEPYNGQTVTIDLDGTRYGGTLDVGTGVLTVDRQIVDMGTLTWILNGGYFKSSSLDSLLKRPESNTEVPQVICSIYVPVNWNTTADKSINVLPTTGSAQNVFLCVKDSSYTDAESFKTAMNGVQLCYTLATPQTVQLTANEVSTLLGQNNIWADTGNTEVTYRADTKLYIQKVMSS